MRRKFTVFVSSTFEDLQEHRRQAIAAVVARGHLPIAMEFFPADYRTSESHISEMIQQSDIVIVIVGQEPGSKMPDGTRFVRFEYELARSLKKSILGFVCPSSVVSKSRLHRDVVTLRNRLMKSRSLVATYDPDSPKTLYASVSDALYHNTERLEKDPTLGWIRAKHYHELEQFGQLDKAVSQSSPFMDLIGQLASYRSAAKKSSEYEFEKRELARAFWKMCLPGIDQRSGIRKLFFENSSTVHYCAEEFMHLLNSKKYYSTTMPDRMALFTNSALTYLRFRLEPPESRLRQDRVELFPKAHFRESYGEAFGELEGSPEMPAMVFHKFGFELDPPAKKNVVELARGIRRTLGQRQGLILMSSTQISLSGNIYQGPIVNSYLNCLFKRSLFLSEVPIVLMAGASKLTGKFDPTRTFPVCGGDVSWEAFLSAAPACICLAVNREEDEKRIVAYFRKRGLCRHYRFKEEGPLILILYNEAFNKLSGIG